MMIDLHIHSNYSDGSWSIEEILKEAKKLGLTQLSITDHNTLNGSIKASKEAKIDFIIGTEISVDYENHELHLLGYFPYGSDYKNVNFVFSEAEAYKTIAIYEMIENLNEQGIDISINDLAEYADSVINRVHICKALIKRGYVKTVQEGFDKYIGDHCPAYVERITISLEDAVKAIHDDNGIAILAHPYEYADYFDIDELLYGVIDLVDGVECFHPSATKKQSEHLVEIANKCHKKITGGSDFHGDNKPNIKLNQMNVNDQYKIER